MALSRRGVFTGFDDFFEPSPWIARDPITDMIAMPILDVQRDPFMVLQRSSPGYEVHQNDKAWQISIDVPGVKAADMKVDLEQNGRLLHVCGGRKVVKDNQMSETRFDKKFTIGDDIDTSKISANLSDGVLVLTAPKKEKKEPESTTIAITEGPHTAAIEDEKKA